MGHYAYGVLWTNIILLKTFLLLGPRHVLPFIGDPFCVIGQDVTAGYEKMHQKYGKIVGFNFAGKLFVSINDLGIIQKVIVN
jgi:hypothetical protein